jgi:hypothetical protein
MPYDEVTDKSTAQSEVIHALQKLVKQLEAKVTTLKGQLSRQTHQHEERLLALQADNARLQQRADAAEPLEQAKSKLSACFQDLPDLLLAAINNCNLNEQHQRWLVQYLHDVFSHMSQDGAVTTSVKWSADVKDFFVYMALHQGRGMQLLQDLRGNAHRGQGRGSHPVKTAELNLPLPSTTTLRAHTKKLAARPGAPPGLYRELQPFIEEHVKAMGDNDIKQLTETASVLVAAIGEAMLQATLAKHDPFEQLRMGLSSDPRKGPDQLLEVFPTVWQLVVGHDVPVVADMVEYSCAGDACFGVYVMVVPAVPVDHLACCSVGAFRPNWCTPVWYMFWLIFFDSVMGQLVTSSTTH